jgi:signal transduction histidine kinase
LRRHSAAWSAALTASLQRLALIGLPLAGLIAALLWVLSLRRQVSRQTAVLAGKIKQETATAERTRIARDMHDSVGARLTQLTLLHDLALAEANLPGKVRETMQTAAASTQQVAMAMDEIVWSLNPRHDTLPSLLRYLGRTGREYLNPLGITCLQEMPTEIPAQPVNSAARHLILGMMKECLQNIAKHACATEVILVAQLDAAQLVLALTDNGISPPRPATADDRDGLHNLFERAQALGGTFALLRHPPGSTARITLPLSHLA